MSKRHRRTATDEPIVAPIDFTDARSGEALNRGIVEAEQAKALFDGLKRMWGTSKILTRRDWEEIKRLQGIAD